MDTGVVKRQVYFAYFPSSNSLRLFEGPENRLRPVFRHSSISSGMMTVVGKIVGHSIVMAVKGSCFFLPAFYYYMAEQIGNDIPITINVMELRVLFLEY